MSNPEIDCWYPALEDSYTGLLPEGFEEWRPADGRCRHDWCFEGQQMKALYDAAPRITDSDLEATKADHELLMDEFHEVVIEDHGAFVVVADVAS